MSLSVAGVPVLSVLFNPVAVTVVSPLFYQRLGPVDPAQLLFVTTVPGFPPFPSVVACAALPAPVDVVLGLDWASHVRETLIRYEYRLDRSFNAWTFFTHPAHPLRARVNPPPGEIIVPGDIARVNPPSGQIIGPGHTVHHGHDVIRYPETLNFEPPCASVTRPARTHIATLSSSPNTMYIRSSIRSPRVPSSRPNSPTHVPPLARRVHQS
ncbi:hypothetical protein C8R47DRAFT_1106949 [Mycena vitilis]|nr:hypothetical protein C8R47DRAFT_1106949 [Mycena vitilis]